jgi:hypothetical protein
MAGSRARIAHQAVCQARPPARRAGAGAVRPRHESGALCHAGLDADAFTILARHLVENALRHGAGDEPEAAARLIRADRRVNASIARCSGPITMRFENTTLLAQAPAGTSA